MKRMNFPERKNQRRKDALIRLEDALKNAINDTNKQNMKRIIDNTKAKIVDGSLFNYRTKVRRSGKRK